MNIAVPLITHGAVTSKGQWPWHVALYKAEGVNLNFNCGATLVSKNKVITGEQFAKFPIVNYQDFESLLATNTSNFLAAHCVTTGDVVKKLISPQQIVLYLGKHKLNQFVEDGSQVRQVKFSFSNVKFQNLKFPHK